MDGVVTDWKEAFLATGDPDLLLAGRSAAVDEIVNSHLHRLPGRFAVAAMGGYGRRELFPCSDIDLLFLIATAEPPDGFKAELSLVLRDLWDAGLRVSHTVRTPAECGARHDNNLPFTISLLDHRFLGGDEPLYREMAQALERLVSRQREALANGLYQLAHARRRKFQESIYHLEPDIKEAPGGMRDLHLLGWLRQLGIRQEPASPELLDARRFLHTLRCCLHLQSNRDNNLLKFELQDAMGAYRQLPFADPAHGMQHYYRHAREVNRAAEAVLAAAETPHSGLWDLFRERRSRLSNSDFTVSRDRVLLRVPGQLDRDPHLPFRLMEFIARHDVKIAPDTEQRLRRAMPEWAARLPLVAPVWPILEPILALPHAALAVRTMQQTGMLTALLPEWKRIDCLVSRDFYHRYTVDEHTLVTLDSLAVLAAATDAGTQRFSRLQTELDRPALLRLSLILHDIGKGEGSDHAERSRELAIQVLERWGVPPEHRGMILFLVEKHLELSSVMTSRDLDDAVTARQLASRLGTLEQLKYLTVMTYADISAVNPQAMTPWRREQLWRVYLTAHHELTRELETDRIAPTADLSPELAAFLGGFPTRYQRTHLPETIRQHQELARTAEQQGVGLSLERRDGFYDVVVIVKDRPFLFASLTGAIASFGLSIVKAEAFANQQGWALDTFVFSDPHRNLELNPSERDRLRVILQDAALGKVDVTRLLRSRPIRRPGSRQVAPNVSVDNEASEAATLFEITAEDRPGLLYDMARTISDTDCDISVVLIDTEADRALDVFYVTHQGHKLSEDRTRLLQWALQSALTE